MNLIPLKSIGVKRNGKTIYPPIGKPFEFTADEVSDIKNLAAKTKIDYYRLPINESPEDAGAKSTRKSTKSAAATTGKASTDAATTGADGTDAAGSDVAASKTSDPTTGTTGTGDTSEL